MYTLFLPFLILSNYETMLIFWFSTLSYEQRIVSDVLKYMSHGMAFPLQLLGDSADCTPVNLVHSLSLFILLIYLYLQTNCKHVSLDGKEHVKQCGAGKTSTH